MNGWMILFFLILIAFICEYVDSSLGMGYGTTLTPVLLMMGYEPLDVVPVVLMSELISGLFAAMMHHKNGNVFLKPRSTRPSVVIKKIREFGFVRCCREGLPVHLKIALVLALCSILGTIAAVFVAVNIPKFWLKLYIGILVLLMGIIILLFGNRSFGFSWKKILGLGMMASFNKGLSGGGYGPVVTSGQVLSGVASRSAVGITSLAEGLTCAVGLFAYFCISGLPLNLRLAPFIVAGAVLSVPFSARSVRKISEKKLKMGIAGFAVLLGLTTVIKTVIG